MKYFIGIVLLVLIFITGFWVDDKYASSELLNQGVLISNGSDLEEIQKITGEYVRIHLAADFEECASLYSENAVYMIP